MKFSAFLKASDAYGGPYKLLLLSLRGGQFIGAILALSCYAWLISTLSSDQLAVNSSNKGVAGIGAYLSLYILISMPMTWLFLETAWFKCVSMGGDVLGIAGSIAVAVLTSGSTGTACRGLFVVGEELPLDSSDWLQACKLQKVVFATGICNS